MNIVEEFDRIINEASVDFVGTGDVRGGYREEELWREEVAKFRLKLEELVKKTDFSIKKK
jgi:hypothetical protein